MNCYSGFKSQVLSKCPYYILTCLPVSRMVRIILVVHDIHEKSWSNFFTLHLDILGSHHFLNNLKITETLRKYHFLITLHQDISLSLFPILSVTIISVNHGLTFLELLNELFTWSKSLLAMWMSLASFQILRCFLQNINCSARNINCSCRKFGESARNEILKKICR